MIKILVKENGINMWHDTDTQDHSEAVEAALDLACRYICYKNDKDGEVIALIKDVSGYVDVLWINRASPDYAKKVQTACDAYLDNMYKDSPELEMYKAFVGKWLENMQNNEQTIAKALY